MGIYRGAGGSGDAVNDASSEALITIQARDAALAAQAAAEAAQAAAELAETNAETAETNAETAETNAETAATNAASSASAASTSASNAATSATNAANSATAAQTAETNAETAETNAAASASAASTSASNAATSATNASNSASAASTSATNASNSASAAATSATNAANSATAAQTAQTAAELAETNAETAEANAETAETNAAASASAAATSASNASTSASNAATSAINASNSASAAATSATNASNSASAASTSASNAATSESNAATSASNAAASYDSFDDRYLGAKSSAPTLDNDGNALLTGALYFNTTTNEMKVWSGSAWLNAYASLSGALLATNNLSDLNNTATARTNLGVAIGTDVQAYDAQLADIAGLTPTDNNFIVGNGTNFVTESGSTARTSLGLGSIATQDANNVAVTGGSINGTTVGASTPSTGSFTSLTDSGNLTFTGTGNRITGDFSNATVGNSVAFQTSTTNGNTNVQAIPNGTATASQYRVYNNSDPNNSAFGQFFISSSEARINSSIVGTGTYLPITMYTGGSERLRIDTSGNVLIGTTSNLSGGMSKGISIYGSSTAGLGLSTSGSVDSQVYYDSSNNFVINNANAGTILLRTNNTERMRIDSSGNVLIGTTSNTGSRKVNVVGSIASTFSDANDIQGVLLTDANTVILASTYGTTGSYKPLAFNTGGSERLRIDTSGNLCVGSTSAGNAGTINVSVGSAGTTVGGLQLWSTTNSTHYVNFGDGTSGTDTYRGYVGYAHGSDSLLFGTSTTERMRIDSSGNVGIGTSSPTSFSGYTVVDAYNGTTGAVFLVRNATKTGQFVVDTARVRIGARTNDPLTLDTNDTERMRITSGGNVGIGTSSPSSKLHVTDSANAYVQVTGNSRSVYVGQDGTGALVYCTGAVPLLFYTNEVERLRIASNGALGLSGANYGTSGQVLTSNGSGSAPSWQSVGGTAPAFSAYQSSNQSGFSTNTWTKLNFQTEEFDTASCYDTTNMRFTPNVAGYYQITACATTTSTSGTTERISIYKNGSIFKAGPNIISYAEGSFVSALVYLDGATDYVEAYYIFPSTARTISGTQSSTYFQGVLVRGA